jgi:hypothetical protein
VITISNSCGILRGTKTPVRDAEERRGRRVKSMVKILFLNFGEKVFLLPPTVCHLPPRKTKIISRISAFY